MIEWMYVYIMHVIDIALDLCAIAASERKREREKKEKLNNN